MNFGTTEKTPIYKKNPTSKQYMGKIRLLTILVILLFGCVFPESFCTNETEQFFCPNDECESRVVFAFDNAKESIHIAMYSFTSEGIADAAIRANNRGLEVKVVLDNLQAGSKNSAYNTLISNNVNARIRKGKGAMHHKFAVIDNGLTITGSFNFTKNANERNHENLVFIFSEKTAREFEDEFLMLWVNSD
jgi:phosphatidylserine/phosphatidylglycerophosphate/cardiolipin synthase-like enzyme